MRSTRGARAVMVCALGPALALATLATHGCGTSPYGTMVGPTPLPDAEPDTAPDATMAPEASAPDAPLMPSCSAQRVVHLVGGQGGLAWFSLQWPAPVVITSPSPTFAYDDPTRASVVPESSADHPLWARTIGGSVLWKGVGAHPMPTVFVSGTNETHTYTPSGTRFPLGGPDVVAAGAALQKGYGAAVPVIGIGQVPYGPTAAPLITSALDINAAVAAIKAKVMLTAAQEADLRPDPVKIATWVDKAVAPRVADLAEKLLFTANAFRLGFATTVVIQALSDDPHGAFQSTMITVVSNALTRVLDAFYVELAKTNEPTCGWRGAKLSMADNVVMLVSGDTTKDPFDRVGWPDGTPDSSNLLYVRSNGFLRVGWFGQLIPPVGPAAARKNNFDPQTGALSMGTISDAMAKDAALGAILYAIARGDELAVGLSTTKPYKGVVASPTP